MANSAPAAPVAVSQSNRKVPGGCAGFIAPHRWMFHIHCVTTWIKCNTTARGSNTRDDKHTVESSVREEAARCLKWYRCRVGISSRSSVTNSRACSSLLGMRPWISTVSSGVFRNLTRGMTSLKRRHYLTRGRPQTLGCHREVMPFLAGGALVLDDRRFMKWNC